MINFSTKSRYRIVPFRAEHARAIQVQKAQQLQFEEVTPEEVQDSGVGLTVLKCGRYDTVLMCFGKSYVWHRRWLIWALLSEDAGKHMRVLTRIAKWALSTQKDQGRFEAIVPTTFDPGHRWAKMVGFVWDHHEDNFLPYGGDAEIYVRYT